MDKVPDLSVRRWYMGQSVLPTVEEIEAELSGEAKGR
jgi:hypothetical protein